MGRWWRTVRFRVVVLLLLVLAPTVLLLAVHAAADRDAAVERVRQETLGHARAAAVAEHRSLEAIRLVLTTNGDHAVRLSESDPAACSELLRRINGTLDTLSGMGVAGPDGAVRCSARGAVPGVSVANTTSFARAVATRAFAVGDFRLHGVTGAPTSGLAYPVLDPDGQVRGVVLASLDLEAVSRSIAALDIPPGYVVAFLDGQGTILARQPDHARWVGRPMPPALAGARGAEGLVVVADGPDGVSRVYATQVLPDGGLSVAVGAPVAAVIAPVEAAFWRNVAIVGGIGALALALALLWSERTIVRPLAGLTEASRRLARGDFEARSGLTADGSETGALGQAFDEMAAELAQAQGKLEELDRVRARFVNVAAHELANPLAPIAMQVDALRGGVGAAEQQRSLDIIERSVGRLTQLTQDIVAAARLQDGTFALARQPVDVARLVEDAAEAHAPRAARAGIALKAATSGALPVVADAQRLAQVLDNLLGNALKFTPGGGAVLVDARAEHGQAVVEVRDSGCGFDPAEAGQLFQPFQRLHGRAGPPGTGLGLYVARSIVEQHGGRVWAASEGPGRGARFGFALPLEGSGGSEARMPPA